MLKKKGKVWKATGNACSHVIYIPADIVKDSTYPFKPKDVVNVRFDIATKSLIITKVRGGDTGHDSVSRPKKNPDC